MSGLTVRVMGSPLRLRACGPNPVVLFGVSGLNMSVSLWRNTLKHHTGRAGASMNYVLMLNPIHNARGAVYLKEDVE